MSTQTLKFLVRNFTIALIIVLVSSSLMPIATLYAQEGEAPPPEPAPVVQESAPPTESTPNETDGTDGTDGQPADTTPQDGEDGEPQDGSTPAEDGEAGDDANAPVDPPAADGTSATINTGNASSDSTTTGAANVTETTTPAPDPNTYPYGKPPAWYIQMCKDYPQPHCDKYIIKPAPVTVEQTNDLVMQNQGESTAETGENTAVDPDGVSITTGNADAFGYLISLFNVAVTNSTGSILFLKNPLGDDLDLTQRILDIFNNLVDTNGECNLSDCSLSDAVLNIITNSTADVSNELVVRSGTGENAATSTDGVASINTGDADAFGSIVNFGNLQIVDSRYMIILMANQGNLNGNVVLPDASFFRTLSTGAKLGSDSSFAIDNGADVTNDGTANADTGANMAVASSTQEIAQINSGDATADSSAMNFVNQIGSPICFVVNVGGEWRGNVVRLPEGFSHEKTDYGDLICGAGSNADRPGARSGLHATTTNYAKVLNKAIVEATTGANSAVGAAANINTGDASAFVQILNVLNQSIIGQDWIFALFSVSGDWKGNMVFGPDPGGPGADPLTQVASQMLAGAFVGGGDGSPGGYTSEPNITVDKTVNVVKATAPAKVDYKIVIKNTAGGGDLYRAKLVDTLKGPDGKRVFARHWNLGTIKNGEEVTVTYTVEYNTDIPYGTYNNTASLSGYRNESIYVNPLPFGPMTDSTEVSIGEDSEVLSVHEGPQCTPLLQTYMKIGKPVNEADVKDLQKFFNDFEGESLDLSGVYDFITIAAVKRFQTKYADEVLTPWGISEPTGHVYYTTQRKVNDLYCVNGETFPLTASQMNEIQGFKTHYQAAPQQVDPVSEEVGGGPNKQIGQTAAGATVFLGDMNAPTSKKEEEKPQAFGGFKSWFGALMPFVDAFEI